MKKILLLLCVWVMVCTGCGGNQSDILNNTGFAKLNKKDYQGAIADFNKALSLNPDNASVYFNRGIAKSWLGDTTAISDYNKSIELCEKKMNFPTFYAMCYFNRAVAKNAMKHYDQAILDYDKALEANPRMGKAAFNKAHTEYQIEKYNDAIIDANRAIAIAQEDTEGHLYLAVSYVTRGASMALSNNYEGGLNNFDSALRLQPNNIYAYINRGRVKYYHGDYPGATDDFNKVIKLNLKNAIAYYYLAMIDMKAGYVDISRNEFRNAGRFGIPGIADTLKKYFP